MRPIATDVARSVVCVSVCLCVGKTGESRCRIGADSCPSNKPRIIWGADPTLEGSPSNVTSRRCSLLPNWFGHLLFLFLTVMWCTSVQSIQVQLHHTDVIISLQYVVYWTTILSTFVSVAEAAQRYQQRRRSWHCRHQRSRELGCGSASMHTGSCWTRGNWCTDNVSRPTDRPETEFARTLLRIFRSSV